LYNNIQEGILKMNISLNGLSGFNCGNNLYGSKNITAKKDASIKCVSTVAFRGNNETSGSVKNPEEFYMIDMRVLAKTPVMALWSMLLKDGYKPEDLKRSGIFTSLNLKDGVDIDVLAEHVDEFQETQITGKDIFNRNTKSGDDIRAMIKLYADLKEKFVTADVLDDCKRFLDLKNSILGHLQEKFGASGEEPSLEEEAAGKILHVLTFTNKDNAAVAHALLDDENFNNMHIESALIGIKGADKAKCGLEVLKIAQETGYDKSFSYALSVLISEADPVNMPVIRKIIEEDQEFLSGNSKFVSEKLMSFLRLMEPELAAAYLEDDTITLQNIDELTDY